jgi:hypothetical protein
MQKTLKIVSYVVLGLIAVAIVYANATGIRYWTGIGV